MEMALGIAIPVLAFTSTILFVFLGSKKHMRITKFLGIMHITFWSVLVTIFVFMANGVAIEAGLGWMCYPLMTVPLIVIILLFLHVNNELKRIGKMEAK